MHAPENTGFGKKGDKMLQSEMETNGDGENQTPAAPCVAQKPDTILGKRKSLPKPDAEIQGKRRKWTPATKNFPLLSLKNRAALAPPDVCPGYGQIDIKKRTRGDFNFWPGAYQRFTQSNSNNYNFECCYWYIYEMESRDLLTGDATQIITLLANDAAFYNQGIFRNAPAPVSRRSIKDVYDPNMEIPEHLRLFVAELSDPVRGPSVFEKLMSQFTARRMTKDLWLSVAEFLLTLIAMSTTDIRRLLPYLRCTIWEDSVWERRFAHETFPHFYNYLRTNFLLFNKFDEKAKAKLAQHKWVRVLLSKWDTYPYTEVYEDAIPVRMPNGGEDREEPRRTAPIGRDRFEGALLKAQKQKVIPLSYLEKDIADFSERVDAYEGVMSGKLARVAAQHQHGDSSPPPPREPSPPPTPQPEPEEFLRPPADFAEEVGKFLKDLSAALKEQK